MLKPGYNIKLDQDTLSSDGLGALMALDVRCCKNGAADEAIIALGRVPSINPSEGAKVSIELGWDGDVEAVFTGTVEAVESGIGGMEIVCLGNEMKMVRTRSDRAFVNQNAGEVVKALADEANVATATIEDGIDLPFYMAYSSMTFYDHALGLARRCGFDLYTTPEGGLIFASFAVMLADHIYRYGAEILDASIEQGTPLDSVGVVPESPASSSGAETASWFVKDPSPHQVLAGSGAATLLLSDALLKTKEAADTAAKAGLSFSQRDAVFGHVELMGSPDVKLGEAVQLMSVPDEGVDGLYQVMSVRHRLDRRHGFRTVAGLGGMPSGGLL
jgi:phage protein D